MSRHGRRWSTRAHALALAVSSVLAMMSAPAASAATNAFVDGSVSNTGNLSGAVSVAVSGNFAYTPSYYSGVLTAVNIGNPAAPAVTGQAASSPSTVTLNASTINIVGGLAYVASKNANGPCLPGPFPMCGSGTNDNGTGNSLSIFDVSTNPAVPHFVGSVTDSTKLFGAYGIAVSGTHAYVASQGCLTSPQPCPDPTVGNRFEVVDVSNPAHPAIVASVTNPASGPFLNALSHATSVAISANGDYAFVTAFNSSRLTIIDISTPTSPSIVASIANSAISDPADVAVASDSSGHPTYAYVASQSPAGTIAVVHVSNPASPLVVGSVSNPSLLSGAYRIRLRGNIAYVSASSAASVTALDISNPTDPVIAGSITDTAHLSTTTGLDVDSTGRYVVAASPYLATQTKSNFPPFGTLTGTISVIKLDPVNTVPPVITAPASLSAGSQLSAVSGMWTGVPAPTFTYQWSRCPTSTTCTPIPGAVSLTYTAQRSDVGATLEVTVTGTNSLGSSSATSAPTSSAVTGAPSGVTFPSVSGTPIQGRTLTASNGKWTGSPPPTFTDQWSRCDSTGAHCGAISGATRSTYTLGAADVGHTLRVLVLATNSVGSSLASSLATAIVIPVNTPPPPTPTINSLRQAAKTWRETTKPAHVIAGRPRPKRLPTGTTFSLTLNESASVKFSFTLKTPGRKVKGRCRKQTSQNRRQRRCTIKAASGSWVLSGRKGANRFKFAGHLAHGKKLRAGSYTVTITATASGKRSKPKTISFTIVS